MRHLDYDGVKSLDESSDEHTDTFEVGFDEECRPGHDDTPEGPAEVNEDHTLTIVSSELDGSTERIIEYLAEEFEVPINGVRFNYYQDDGREYIARTWLNDPYEFDETDPEEESRATWNGHDFYANFGENEFRKWSDAREYGYYEASRPVDADPALRCLRCRTARRRLRGLATPGTSPYLVARARQHSAPV